MEQLTFLFAVRWWAIIGGIVINFILGMLWFGPFFGKPWMKAIGVTEKDIREKPNYTIYLATLLFAIISTYSLAIILNGLGTSSVAEAIGASALLWFGFNFVHTFNHRNFENVKGDKPISLLLITSLYDLTVFIVVGIFLQLVKLQ